jgi:hypothetical protein
MVPLHVRLLGSIAAATIALALSGPVSAFEKYLPEKTEVVLGMNVRQMIESPPIKKYGPALMAEYWFTFLVLTNKDAFKAVLEGNPGVFQKDKAKSAEQLAMMAEYGAGLVIAGPLDGRDEDVIVILQGKFEPEKAKEVIQFIGSTRFLGLSVTTQKVGEREVYEVVPPQIGAKGLFVAVADNRHILLAESKEWILASLADSTSNAKPRFNDRLQTLLGKVDRTQSAWMVAAPVKDFQLEEVTAGIRIDSDIRMEVNVVAKSEVEAQAIAGEATMGLGQLGGTLKDLAREFPELSPLVPVPEAAKVTLNGKIVQFNAQIDAPVVEDLLRLATKERP